MKFGMLKHVGFAKKNNTEPRLISMGDIFEFLIIHNIYLESGVSEDNIVYVNPYELQDYSGEYLVVPINYYSIHINYSPRILPVFLGLTLGGTSRELLQTEQQILKRFQPVGCRDERTFRLCQDLGLDSYLNGCLVATFPNREEISKYGGGGGLYTLLMHMLASSNMFLRNYWTIAFLQLMTFLHLQMICLTKKICSLLARPKLPSMQAMQD